MTISVEVGRRIKQYRQKLNLTLKDIESRVDVSATHVSEIERGKTSPTIGALHKIAVSLDLDLAYFLESEPLEEVAHQREFEREWIADGERGRWASLTPRVPGARLSGFRMELEPGVEALDAVAGDSDDVFLVERGTVRFEHLDRVHVLAAGDSIHLRSGTAYRYVNAGESVAEVFQFSGYRRSAPSGYEAPHPTNGALPSPTHS